MFRRLVSFILSALVLANLVAAPSAVLAEVLQHEQETALLDSQIPPVDPAPVHCQHGCAGHIGQHFQWHVPTYPIAWQRANSEPVATPVDTVSPLHIPTLPFRPPLTASIRS